MRITSEILSYKIDPTSKSKIENVLVVKTRLGLIWLIKAKSGLIRLIKARSRLIRSMKIRYTSNGIIINHFSKQQMFKVVSLIFQAQCQTSFKVLYFILLYNSLKCLLGNCTTSTSYFIHHIISNCWSSLVDNIFRIFQEVRLKRAIRRLALVYPYATFVQWLDKIFPKDLYYRYCWLLHHNN